MFNYPHMTLDELYDNYHFKVVKRAIMREFPWIKDVWVKEDELNKYGVIFLNIEIDPIKLGEEKGWTVTPWVKTAADKGRNYSGMYLSLFFDKVDYDETRELQQDINDLANSVGDSPALPSDLKIKGDRRFSLGDIHVNHGAPSWFG